MNLQKPFLIAEIGINHNGDIKIAKDLIKSAKDANFDSVKFQKRNIDLVYSKEILDSSRESPWGKTQRDQKKGLEFGREEYDEIDSYCKELNIDWFFSAWDMDSLEFSEPYNFNYHKIASAMIVDTSFLKEVAKPGLRGLPGGDDCRPRARDEVRVPTGAAAGGPELGDPAGEGLRGGGTLHRHGADRPRAA